MRAVPSSGCTVNILSPRSESGIGGRKSDTVTGASVYLINSVAQYIFLDGKYFKKQKEREFVTVSSIGVQHQSQ
jgi:hypothetical protein